MDDISDVIGDAAANDTTDVFVRDIKYLGRDTDEIAEHIEALLESGTNIHTDPVTLDLDPEHGETAADLARAIGAVGPGVIPIPDTDELVNDDDAVGGRPPVGFEYNTDGELTTTDDYAKICRELSKAAKDEQSNRATAKEIGCAPRTVKRAIEDRPERYQL